MKRKEGGEKAGKGEGFLSAVYACLLISLALSFSMSGCSPNRPGEKDKNMDTGEGYRVEARYVPEGEGNLHGCGVWDHTLYYSVRVSGDESNKNKLYAMDLTTGESRELPFGMGEKDSVDMLTVLGRGELALFVRTPNEENGLDKILCVFDASGQESMRADIGSILGQAVFIRSMEADSDGNLYLLCSGEAGDRIFVFNNTGACLSEINAMDEAVNLCRDGEGRVDLLCQAQGGGLTLRLIDVQTGTLGEAAGELTGGDVIHLCVSDGEGMVWLGDSEALYCYDIKSEEERRVLEWKDCGIDAEKLCTLAALADGRIAVFIREEDEDTWEEKREVIYLSDSSRQETASKQQESENREENEKTVLTLASVELDGGMEGFYRRQISEFNRESETIQIRLKQYSPDEAGLARLNADILSGDSPDFLLQGSVNLQAYISRGVFVDLYPWIEQEQELSREDLTASVLRCYERNGSLYVMPLFFYIETLLARTKDVGEDMGWSIEDMKEILSSWPEDTYLFNCADRESCLMQLAVMNMDSYIDWESGECFFDSPAFIGLLELAGRVPDENFYSMDRREAEYTAISRGKMLAVRVPVRQVSDYQIYASLFGGEPVTCIGFPSESGIGCVMVPLGGIGILERSSHKEEAWEFLKYLLSEKSQDEIGSAYGFPVRESSLQKRMEEDSKREGNGIGWIDFEYSALPCSEKEVALVRTLIDQARPYVYCGKEVYAIIEEEAAAYFAGQKSAEETADAIQRRVSIYIAENH